MAFIYLAVSTSWNCILSSLLLSPVMCTCYLVILPLCSHMHLVQPLFVLVFTVEHSSYLLRVLCFAYFNFLGSKSKLSSGLDWDTWELIEPMSKGQGTSYPEWDHGHLCNFSTLYTIEPIYMRDIMAFCRNLFNNIVWFGGEDDKSCVVQKRHKTEKKKEKVRIEVKCTQNKDNPRELSWFLKKMLCSYGLCQISVGFSV